MTNKISDATQTMNDQDWRSAAPVAKLRDYARSRSWRIGTQPRVVFVLKVNRGLTFELLIHFGACIFELKQIWNYVMENCVWEGHV